MHTHRVDVCASAAAAAAACILLIWRCGAAGWSNACPPPLPAAPAAASRSSPPAPLVPSRSSAAGRHGSRLAQTAPGQSLPRTTTCQPSLAIAPVRPKISFALCDVGRNDGCDCSIGPRQTGRGPGNLARKVSKVGNVCRKEIANGWVKGDI